MSSLNGSSSARLTLLGSVLLAFLAASSAPTPLYASYQQAWGFSTFWLTLVFAVYAFALLAALLVGGRLSDHLGRRPVILAALVLEAGSMLLFHQAHDLADLVLARALQGLATGIATSALGAALLDVDAERGPWLNSLTPLLGMAVGALGCGLLVEFAPAPLQLVYRLFLLLFVLQGLALLRLPDRVPRRPGLLAALRPQLAVPPQARATLWRVLPLELAVWAVGGFYLSLMPGLVKAATGTTSILVGGVVVAGLTLTGAACLHGLRLWPAARLLRLGAGTLVAGPAVLWLAVASGQLGFFALGTLVTGVGFGSGFLGATRSLLPLAEPTQRAGLLAAFYVLSYLAFCLPALAVSALVPRLGLAGAAELYLGGVILLAALGVRNSLPRACVQPG
ncbi:MULTISPECIES: MFS transporter [unclassified Pseudomonas]|uniref:MFS transporter n=1 Tax=unclassified Pseudomonas TaxID=196821 RepID=UPI00236306F3|nr:MULTISPECIES: MFS transporter [unclassified Pseudomonas]MDR6179380.1 MFS family permease [Pseudomonas sp. SORGH_AS_0211]